MGIGPLDSEVVQLKGTAPTHSGHFISLAGQQWPPSSDHFRRAVCGHSQAAVPNPRPRSFFLYMGTFWKVLPRAGVEWMCINSDSDYASP